MQEHAFKEGAAAVALDQHRGNCGRLVANVAVITELGKLAVRSLRDNEALARLGAERPALTATAAQTTEDEHRAQAALATRRRRLDAHVAAGTTSGTTFARIAIEHQAALVRAEQATATAARDALAHNQSRTSKLEPQLAPLTARQRHLQAQRTIRSTSPRT